MKNRKFLYALLWMGVSLSFLFSGCSKNAEEDGAAEGVAQPESITETKEETEEKIYLEFYNRKREVYDIMEQIISAFNQSQDRIEVHQIMNTNAEVPLRISAAKNDLPDIILMSGLQNTDTMEYIMGEYLLELEDMECVERIREDYLPSLTYDGHIYQIPMALGFEGIYVNRSLFASEGLEIPTTYEELCAVCEAIMDRGKTPFIFADTEGWIVHQNWECIQSVSTDDFSSIFTNVAENECTFWEQEISRESMQKLIELHRYTNEENQELNYDEAMNRFAEGNAFMFMQGSWAYRNIIQQNPDLDLEMIPFPVEEGQEQYFTLWVDSSVGIAKNCEYPEEAKEFLEYLMQPEVLQMYLDEEDIIGCVEGARIHAEYAPRINQLIDSGQAKMDATWIPSPTSVIRDQDIAALMPDASDGEIKDYMDVLTSSLRKHSQQFLAVKEKMG